MVQFLKYTLASFTGVILFLLLSFLTIFLVMVSMEPDSDKPVKEKSVLHLQLAHPILERAPGAPFSNIDVGPFKQEKAISLLKLQKTIRHAASNDRVKGIFLDIGNVQAGFSSLREIRKSLSVFKDSGKFIYAYGKDVDEGGLYLSSVANQFYLNPMGYLEFNGLHYEMLFFKDLLDRLKIEPRIFRVGEYKSAVEPFMRRNMSEETKAQSKLFLNGIYDIYLKDVARSLDKEVAELKKISDSMKVRNAGDARHYGLIDDTKYYSGVLDSLKSALNIGKNNEVNFVSLEEYYPKISSEEENGDEIAVLYGTGEIAMGSGDKETIGSDQMAKKLRELRKDDDVKAVVLRINSPGGSALASDIIWKEIQLTTKKKPVIASMSDIAASGGYYLAMGCDTIVANPNTITGSIGIFGLFLEGNKFLKEKLGITSDGVSTGEFSDVGTFTNSMGTYEEKQIQEEVERIYEVFLEKAAKGRDMPREEIRKVAGGRVWTGKQAEERNLVDTLGGMQTAVKIAADKAGLKTYQLNYYPEQESFLDKVVDKMFESKAQELFKNKLGSWYPYWENVDNMKDMQGINARLPFYIKRQH